MTESEIEAVVLGVEMGHWAHVGKRHDIGLSWGNRGERSVWVHRKARVGAPGSGAEIEVRVRDEAGQPVPPRPDAPRFEPPTAAEFGQLEPHRWGVARDYDLRQDYALPAGTYTVEIALRPLARVPHGLEGEDVFRGPLRPEARALAILEEGDRPPPPPGWDD